MHSPEGGQRDPEAAEQLPAPRGRRGRQAGGLPAVAAGAAAGGVRGPPGGESAAGAPGGGVPPDADAGRGAQGTRLQGGTGGPACTPETEASGDFL